MRTAIEMLMEKPRRRRVPRHLYAGASGLQLAEALHKLKNPPSIVFVTAYSDHAVEAFDVDAVDYLLKPVEEARTRSSDRKGASPARNPRRESKVTIERIPVEKGGRKVAHPRRPRFATSWRRTTIPASSPTMTASFPRPRSAQFRGQALRFRLLPRASPLHRESGWRGGCRGRFLPVRSSSASLAWEDRVPVSRRRVVPLMKALSL